MTEEQFELFFGVGQQGGKTQQQQNPKQPTQSTTPKPTESKGFISTAVDTVKGIASGAFKEAENTVQAIHDVANAVDNKFLEDKYVDNDKDYDFVPDALKPDTGVGKTAQAISAFATGWIAGGKLISGTAKVASKVPQLAKLAARVPTPNKYVQTVAKGGVIDFITGDGSDERLADVIVDNDLFGKSLVRFLASDKDDTLLEGRLKNVIEGAALGVATETVMGVFKAMKKGSKQAAKEVVNQAVSNKKAAAEVLDATKPPTTVEEAIAKAGDKWAASTDTKLTKRAVAQKTKEAIKEDPQAVLKEMKKAYNSDNYVQSAKALIDVFEPTLAEQFPKDTPVMKQWFEKALDHNLNAGLDKDFNAYKTLLQTTGDFRIDTAARAQWLNWWAPDYVKQSLQNVHEGIEGSMKELRDRASGVFDVLATQKQLNVYVGQTGKANDIVRGMSETVGEYATSGKGQGIDIPVPHSKDTIADGYKQVLDNITDDELIEAMSTFTRLADAGDAETMTKVVASMAPKGHPMRKAFNVPDRPIWNNLNKYRYAAMLSGVKTHIRNCTGNTFKLPIIAAEKVVQGAYLGAAHAKGTGFSGVALGALQGAREGAQYTTGLFYALPQATATLMDALRYGEAITRPSEYNTLVKGAQKSVIGDSIVTFPLRVLAATDEFFSSLSGTANAYQRAMLDLQAAKVLDGVTDAKLVGDIKAKWIDDYLDNAFIDTQVKNGTITVKSKTFAYEADKDIADYATFQQALDKTGQRFSKLVNDTPFLKVVFPFVHTPWNITKDAFWTHGVGAPIEVAQAFKSGDITKQAEAMSHLASATALWLSAYSLVCSGHLTGKGPDNKFERDALAETGYQPDSIKVGDQYISLNLMEPYGSILGFLATEVEQAQRNGDVNFSVDAISSALFTTVKDKTFMRGLFDLVQSVQRGTMTDDKGFPSQVGLSFVPNLLRDLGQALDPVKKQTPDFYSKVLNKTPFRDDLAPKVSWITGSPLSYSHGGGFGAIFNPGITEEHKSMLFSELSKLGDIKDPLQTIGNYELTPLEYAEYCQTIAQTKIDGMTLMETLDKFINSDEYMNSIVNNPDPTPYELNDVRSEQLKKIITAFKRQGKKEYAAAHRELFVTDDPNVDPFEGIVNF